MLPTTLLQVHKDATRTLPRARALGPRYLEQLVIKGRNEPPAVLIEAGVEGRLGEARDTEYGMREFADVDSDGTLHRERLIAAGTRGTIAARPSTRRTCP